MGNYYSLAKVLTRNLSKFKQWQLPQNSLKHENNCSKHEKKAPRTCKYTKKKALLDKREDFENLFAQLTREHIKL